MRLKPFMPLAFLVLCFALFITRIESAPTGNLSTYLPLTQRGNGYALPQGNLLLYTGYNNFSVNLFLSTADAPPETDTFQITNYTESTSIFDPQFSPNGEVVAYITFGDKQVLWVQPTTGTTPIPIMTVNGQAVTIGSHLWSPDGQILAFIVGDANQNTGTLYFYNLSNQALSSIPQSENISRLLWSPTQDHLYYLRYANTPGLTTTLYRANTDGTNPVAILTSKDIIGLRAALPDGRLLIRTIGQTSELYLLNSDGSNLTPLTNDGEQYWFEEGIAYNPQGTRFVYFQDEIMYYIDDTGTVLWQYAFPCEAEKCGPNYVTWSPDGTEIAVSYMGKVYALIVNDTPQTPTVIAERRSRLITYSPDSRYLAYAMWGQSDNFLTILDRTTQISHDLAIPTLELQLIGWRPLP
jgi:WD40 repeat protein